MLADGCTCFLTVLGFFYIYIMWWLYLKAKKENGDRVRNSLQQEPKYNISNMTISESRTRERKTNDRDTRKASGID